MNRFDNTYMTLVDEIMTNGVEKIDRTGVGTRSLFGYQNRYDLSDGLFPLLTVKRVPFKLVVSELLWFIKGDTNIRYLLENDNRIWTEWAFEKYIQSPDYHGPDMTDFGLRAAQDDRFKRILDEEIRTFELKVLNDDAFAEKYGDLGNVYGKQWRNWTTPDGKHVDQLQSVIEMLKDENKRHSRRLIVNSWNVGELDTMALPPCHMMYQFYVTRDNKLNLQLYQRSADTFLGVPFNIASYSLLLIMVAQEVGLDVGEFIHTFGDAHLYNNHMEAVNELKQNTGYEPPTVTVNKQKSIFDLEMEDVHLHDYESHKTIKAPIAV